MSRNFVVIRIWLILTVVVISLTGTPAFAQSAAIVRVDPSVLSAKVNDTVNLSIKAENIANLTAFELHLSFNPSILEVVQVSNGGFVTADFVAQNVFDNAAGTIDYAAAQMNRTPAQGSGALLTIAFRAKANGSSAVALRTTQAAPSGLLLSNSDGMAIQASWADGNVNVGSPATATATPVTPAPATATPVTPSPATATPVTPKPATATPVTPGAATATPITPKPATATPVTPTPVTPTPVPAGAILGTHTVRLGESLYCIGRAYKVSPWAIANTNGIWWPYIIFPYQSLRIPNVTWYPIPGGTTCQAQFSTSTPIPTTAVPTPVTAIPPTAVPPSACRAIYIVRPGDNLFHIAALYGTNYLALARVNQIQNPRLIYSGQRLCIP